MITIPPLDLLSMATGSVHDRLGRKHLRARRVFWHHHHPFLPVWSESENGRIKEVRALKLETALFDSDITWTRHKATWQFRIVSPRSVLFLPNLAGPEDVEGAVQLAELRQDPGAYGKLLGLQPGLVDTYTRWLTDRGIPDDYAEVMALKAFTDAVDRAVYMPGVRIFVVIHGLMRQRLLNQIRDKGKQGILHQSRRDVSMNDDSAQTATVTHGLDPLMLASNLARAYASQILSGKDRDEAAASLALTAAEQAMVEEEIGRHIL